MALRYDCGEVITAMVTPMEKPGAIDYDRVEKLAKYLIDNGSDAILVAGTTGESPTLTNEEEIEIVMNALAGYPTVTTSEFADKVEKVLRNYKESEDNE